MIVDTAVYNLDKTVLLTLYCVFALLSKLSQRKPNKPATFCIKVLINYTYARENVLKVFAWEVFFFYMEAPWSSLVKSSCDESCIGSKWSCRPRGGKTLSAAILIPPAAPASVATGWLLSKGVTAATIPCKTKLNRSGLYLVLSNDKSPPHSTASAAGTCWRPSVKGIVYVVGDPELITITPSPIHYCSSR